MQKTNKVIAAEYMEDKDLLIFTLKNLSDNKEQSYCWPTCDYFLAIGISPKTNYTADHLHKHCSDMLGKELKFIVEGEPTKVNPKIDESKAEEIMRDCQALAEEAGKSLDKEINIAREITR